MRLVWEKASRRYNWHLVVDNGKPAAEPNGSGVMAGDQGEIHPIALTDGVETVVVSARALRSVRQYTNRRLAELQRLQAAKVKRSHKWQKLQRRKNRFLAQQKRRTRDIEHKVSRATVDVAVACKVGTLELTRFGGRW
jgi:transposase